MCLMYITGDDVGDTVLVVPLGRKVIRLLGLILLLMVVYYNILGSILGSAELSSNHETLSFVAVHCDTFVGSWLERLG